MPYYDITALHGPVEVATKTVKAQDAFQAQTLFCNELLPEQRARIDTLLTTRRCQMRLVPVAGEPELPQAARH